MTGVQTCALPICKINVHNGGISADIHSEMDSIEHILPQNPSAEWSFNDGDIDRYVYKLGNMCLLEKKLNNNLGNKNYTEKSEIYKTSTFLDTREIAENYSEWTADKINTRQSKMGKVAKGIWKINF